MSFFRRFSLRRALALVLAAMLVLAPALAEARAGGGFSFGSRGGRTYSAPPITSTNPGGAATINRSMTGQASPNQGLFRPAGPSGFFGGGFGRGLLGGFIGAGIFGLLFGHGFFGGLGGGMSLIGLLVQLGLIYLVVRWAMSYFRSRQPGYAGAGLGTMRSGLGGGFGVPGGSGPQNATLTLQGADFNTFEYLLGAIQTAFGAENLEQLRPMVTPEMASYFAEQIADNARKGLVNELSDVHLVKGDLAEAWSEPDADYATVAMRFSLNDVTRERAGGRIVAGDPSHPVEATELWTFRRHPGSGSNGWQLSAIQQAR
jgi:predicted lipid-binding transport protein (Tim44 family)